MKKTKAIIVALALGASACLLVAQDDNQGPRGPKGGPGGIHLLPPHAGEVLNLTEAQKSELDALESETAAKLEQILTDEQMEKLETMTPPPPPQDGQMGRGGPGGNRRP